MAFFDDLFGAITGQQSAPQQTIIPTGELFSQAGALLPQFAQANLAYNQALQPGITALQLASEAQQDPRLRPLIQATTGSIFDELALGNQISPDLQADITRQLLESGAASGFGVSPAGRGRVISQTASERERIGQQRRAQALGAIPTLRNASPFFEPRETAGLMNTLAGDIRGVQAARDELANVQEDIRRQNFSNLLNTGGKILGSVAGGIFGGPMGAQLGGQIGGSLIQGGGVRGVRQAPAGGGFGSILGGLFGGGGAGGGGFGGNTVGDFPAGFGSAYSGAV